MRALLVLAVAFAMAGCSGSSSTPAPTAAPTVAATTAAAASATPFRTPPPLGSFELSAMEQLFGHTFLVDRQAGVLKYEARFTNVWFTYDVADDASSAIRSTGMVIFDVRTAPTSADSAGQKAWSAWLNNWSSEAAQWVLAQGTKYWASPGPKVTVEKGFGSISGVFLMDFPTTSKGAVPAVASTSYVTISLAR